MKKKKIIIAFGLLISGILILILISINKPSLDNNKPDNSKLTGRDLVYAEEEVIALINSYLTNIQILEYAKTNDLKEITLEKLASEFSLDLSDFNDLEYKCHSKTTTINFNLDYTNYYIILDCKAFYND